MNLKRILNVVGVLLLIAIVIPFVIYAMPITVGADHSFVVLTASMTPAIAPGDVVIVADRDPATIGEGDVITFTRGDNEIPVTHRVTGIVESSSGLAFETKGDANSDPDASPVPANNVVGTVILTIPYIGYVIQFTNTPYGFAALVAVPIGLFVVSELWTLYRQQSVTVTPDSDRTEASMADEVSEDAADTSSGSGGFVITPRTLEGAFLPLLALTIYSVYTVSVRLTEITVSVAVGSVISLLALSVLIVSARRQSGDASTPTERDLEQDGFEPERPTADGGVDQDPVEADLSPDSSDDRGVVE
ncbi:MAG: signal peptidase I [Natronomonas sp.]